jgi:phenylacetate-CoA ligase
MDNPDVGYTEFLDDSFLDVSSWGETGNIVCTGFLNYKQPLIRYKIGDKAKLATKQNLKCGRHFKKIEEIVGRNEDFITTNDGRIMVRFHSLYLGLDKIKRGQLIQIKKNVFVLNLEVTESLNQKERELILNRAYSQLGHVSLEIIESNEISVTNNGKFKTVIKISDED